MTKHFSFITGCWEGLTPEDEYIEMATCQQCNCTVPEDDTHILDIIVCNDCLPDYYKAIVEAEDEKAIVRYHEYMAKNPYLTLTQKA